MVKTFIPPPATNLCLTNYPTLNKQDLCQRIVSLPVTGISFGREGKVGKEEGGEG